MKQFGFCLVALLAALSAAQAQVSVDVILDQDQFLPGESLPVKVRITNRSGQPLHLGANPDWLTFSVESRDGGVIPRMGEVPVVRDFVLESSEMGTKRVDLAPYFVLNQAGRFAIVATVRIPNWDREITSRPKNFSVVNGARLWEREFGVPQSSSDTNPVPEVRKYILEQASYGKGQTRLFLRVTDALGGKVFRVFPIGSLVTFSRPDPQVDKFSNLHVMYANGPGTYSYTAFDPDGNLIARQAYDYVETRPRLHPQADGSIAVIGGVRRITANDRPSISATEKPSNQ